MSKYVEVQTAFKSEAALIEALKETGAWTHEQIEIHQEPVNLFGFENDQRPEMAHIMIRRQHVGRLSNDIGFERTSDGTYRAHISDWDKRRYDENWMKRLRQNYAFHAVRLQQEAKGRQVMREKLPDGRQRVMVRGYR